MSKQPKVTGRDMRGVMAYPPTPALPGAERVDAVDTVDLAETERMIRCADRGRCRRHRSQRHAGRDGHADSRRVEGLRLAASPRRSGTMNPDFPVFIGTTTLNTRDTVSRMKFLADLGITGTLLGRPMWGDMVAPVMERFYSDVAEAVPEHGHRRLRQHRRVRRHHPAPRLQDPDELPQVVAVKYAGGASVGFRYHNDMAHTGTSFPLMSIETDWFPAWEMYGEELVGMAWSSTTAMGPGPVLELRDALQQGRTEDARWLTERLRWAHEPFLVGQDFMEFAKYNIPLEKIRVNEAGYINVGKCRPPYTEDLVPDEHVRTTLEHVARYKQISEEIEKKFGPRKKLAQV